MSLAFTGTRKGMTDAQKRTVKQLLQAIDPKVVDHGCCEGADRDFHLLCEMHTDAHVHGWPSVLHQQYEWAMENIHTFYTVHQPMQPLARNQKMRERAKIVIACPKEDTEPSAQRAGGTWSMIRQTRKDLILLFIVWPDGHFDCFIRTPH